MAEKEQKVYLTQALQKRRAAFKAENWAEYEQIVYEMSIQEQGSREQVLARICESLNLTEEQFVETNDVINRSDRAEELKLAMQG